MYVAMKDARGSPADSTSLNSSSSISSYLDGRGILPRLVESDFTGEAFTRDDLVEDVTAVQIRRLKAQVDAENAAAVMAPKSPKASGSSETRSWFSAMFSYSSPKNKNSLPPPSCGGDLERESAIVDIYDNLVDLDEGDRVRDFSMLDDDTWR